MRHRIPIGIFTCALALSFIGCGPSRPAVNNDARDGGGDRTKSKEPFATDALPAELLTHCRSQTLADGCDAVRDMDARLGKLLELHASQMVALEELVKPIAPLLQHPEAPPAVTVSADQPDTKSWTVPDGLYPTKMTLRVEFKDGYERLKTDADVAAELPKLVKALKKGAKEIQKEWAEAMAEAKVVVPKDVLAARAATSLTLSHDGQSIVAKHVPGSLLSKYVSRDQPHWAGVASHVIDLSDLTNLFLSHHAVPMQPAMTVASPKGGKGGFAINVTTAKRERHVFESKIMGRHFCDELRAEMRFVHAGKTPPRKVVFRKVAGGVR